MSARPAIQMKRAAVIMTCVAATAALAGCGGSDDTVTGGIVVPTTIEADPAISAVSTPAETAPPATAAPATAAPATATASTAPAATVAPTAEATGGYEPISRLIPPSRSDPVAAPLPDGTYWSWNYSSDGSTVQFVLTQLFLGNACREQFGQGEDTCLSDNETLNEPTATVSMPAGQGSTSVVVPVGPNFESYRVSQEEFARLVAGGAPASDAPAGYNFVPEGVIVVVRNGQAVSADQVFIA